MADREATRRLIWILLLLLPLALFALPQLLWRSSREGRLPPESPPDPASDLPALAARAREAPAERDRFGSLVYTLAPESAHKISLRCDTSAPADRNLTSGKAVAALVAYQVTDNPLQGDGYGVYLTGSRIERLRYDAWRVGPGHPPLGVYHGRDRVHPQELGRLPMHEACEVLKYARGVERYNRDPRHRGGCNLDLYREGGHMIFLDLLVDLRKPRALGPADRSRVAKVWQTVTLKPTAEIHDEIALTFEGAGEESGGEPAVRMTVEWRRPCLDAYSHL